MADKDTAAQIRRARSKFIAMAATYSLGAFNDSFFRQSAMLLAVGEGVKHMQGWIMAVFTLPYLLFASPAGWLADRFSKRQVVIGAKLLELAAMLCGAWGICIGNWHFIMTMVFVMGLQACLFSPALNGSIPELYPSSYVTKANAILKVVVTAAILGGISSSGLVLSRHGAGWGGIPMGRLTVAIGAVGVSVVGLLGSLGVARRPAADPHVPFPWSGPVHTIKELILVGKDRLLAIIVVANVFLWFAGAVLIPLINVLAMDQFGRAEDVAGYMVAAEVVGVAIGGFIGSRLARGERWYSFLPASIRGMGIVLLIVSAVPALPQSLYLPASFILMAGGGVFGGAAMIPCEAFVQIRPPGQRKGAVIAATNFAVFAGIIVSGPVANLLVALVRPTAAMGVVGVLAILAGLWLRRALRKVEEDGIC